MEKKSFIRIKFFILNIFFLFCFKSFAQEIITVRVGFYHVGGYHEMDEHGVKSGAGYDFLQMIAPYAGFRYEFIGYEKSWAEMLEMLDKGEIDILTTVQKSPEREKKYAFSKRNVGMSSIIITTTVDNQKCVAGDFSTLNGICVALKKESLRSEIFKNHFDELGLKYTVKYYDSNEDMLEALHKKEVDAVATNNLRIIESDEIILDSFDEAPYYAITRKESDYILKRLDKAIIQLEGDIPSWRENIKDRNQSGEKENDDVVITDYERKILSRYNKESPLKILINPDMSPYSVVKNGKAEGIFYDLIKMASVKFDFAFEIVDVKTSEEYLNAIQTKQADIVFAWASTYDTAEQFDYNLTESYYSDGFAILHKKNRRKPNIIAAKDGVEILNPRNKKIFGNRVVIPEKTLDQCVNEVKNGNADCTYMFTYSASNYVSSDIKGELDYAPIKGNATDFRIAVNKYAPAELFSVMNKFANSITDDTIRSIVASHRTSEKESMLYFIYRHPIEFIFTIVFIFIITSFLILEIRKKKHAESSAQQAGSSLSALLGGVKGGIIVRSYGSEIKYEYISKEAAAVLGYTPDELKQFLSNNFIDIVHPDDVKTSLMDRIVLQLNSSNTYFTKYRMLHKSGKWIWISDYGKKVDTKGRIEVYSLIQNIDEQEKIYELLKLERASFRDAFTRDSMFSFVADITDGIIVEPVLSTDGTDYGLDLGFTTPAPYDEFIKRICNQTMIKFLTPNGADLISREGIEKANNSGVSFSNIDVYIEKIKKYIRLTFLYSKNPFNNHLMTFCMGSDITVATEEKLEREKKEQYQKNLIIDSLKRAETASKAKTEFLNNMSHDIRTPMNAIVGFTDLAVNHLDDKTKVEEYLKKIRSSSNHLLNLINDVLDMSRIESGKMQIEEKENSLEEIMDEIKEIVQQEALNRNLNLSFDFESIKHPHVFCDKLRLNQILLNCIGNAIKFTPDGGSVKVSLTENPCRSKDYYSYEFKISDTGIGMNRDFINHVFDPFERESSSTVSGIQGTGLGMSICKNIVDMMSGDISVKSEKNVGTEFTIRLDFKTVEQPVNSEAETLSENTDEENNIREDVLNGLKVLLVEDNAINREIALEVLKDKGAIVEYAENGLEAVEKIQNSDSSKYDIIFMDVQMPVMNGYEASRKIRALEDKEKSSIPIVAMTANVFESDRKLALEAGMNDHISKPIDYTILEKVVRKIKANQV